MTVKNDKMTNIVAKHVKTIERPDFKLLFYVTLSTVGLS